jgi:hypothetical protein
MAFRPFMLAAACMPLLACGGEDGQPEPQGEHYHYVANEVFVPTTNTQAREYGLDLNGDKTVDNQLGMVLSTLAGMGFEIQGTIDKSVAEGDIILLVDFQTEDFSSTTAAGIQVFLGDMPAPAACNTGETFESGGCAHHLDGSGSFAIAANSPSNAALAGKIINGTFTGGPGDLTLQIALGGTTAIQLDLIGARAKATTINDSTIGSVILGGAITKEDIDNKVIPAIQGQLGPIIAEDCTMLSSPPDCGCASGSTGKTILGLFDTMPKDCNVTVDEIKNNNLIVSLLAPDVTINGKMALSIGVKATAVKATYTAPNQ